MSDLTFNIDLRTHKPEVPGGHRYCSELAQQSLFSSYDRHTLPPDVEKAAGLTGNLSLADRVSLAQECLVSMDMRVREKIIKTFSPLKEMLPALIESLSDSAWQVRARAAKGLANHPTAESIEPLIALLHDDVHVVRLIAAHTLGEFGRLAETALPSLKVCAFGPDIPKRDAEEEQFKTPWCGADISRLALDSGLSDMSDNWLPGSYQLYAIEAYSKIKKAVP